MRYLSTPHYRLINLAVAVLLLLAGVNRVVESPFLPAYKQHLLYAAFAIAAVNFFFVKPTPDVGPLRVPPLSLVNIRIISGVLLLACTFSLANYYLFDPGLFAPYKKQVLVATFAIMGLFVILYSKRFAELAEKRSIRDDGDA